MGNFRKTTRQRRPLGPPGLEPRGQISVESALEADAFESESTHPTDRADRCRAFLVKAAIVILAGLWIYSPAYHGDWLWDDDQLLTQNPVVQSGSLQGLAKLWFNPDGADYFPLSYTALWMQWPFFGPTPTGYHVVTILLHITGSLLLWLLLTRMKIPGAWLSAVIFAIHPVCVESVAWVSELKNTLSLSLFLLSAIYYVEQDAEQDAELDPDQHAPHNSAKQTQLYLLSLLFFLLAMFAKTSVVTMPLVILLHAWWKRGRIAWQDILRSAPFFAISLVLGIITIYYQHGRAIGQETILVGGVLPRIATSGMLILFYLWTIVWPVHLLPIYPRWEVDPPKLWQFLAWPVILGTAAWLWSKRETWGRHAIFGFGFFLLMVLPVLGFITISYMRITWAADHFIYLPMIGVISLFGAAASLWYKQIEDSAKPVCVAGTAILLGALGFLSFRYANAWANEDALWTHTLIYNHDAWQAHNRLGAKKFARGDVEGAFYHFTNSTRLRPDLGETHNNLGTALSAKGRLNDAIVEFAEACRVTPHVPAIQVNLANALAAAGRFGEAGDKYKDLIAREPGNAALINNYGVTLYKQGEKEKAIEQFRKAIAIAPNMKDARESLAVALGEKPDPNPVPQAQKAPQLEMSLPVSPTLGPSPQPTPPHFR